MSRGKVADDATNNVRMRRCREIVEEAGLAATFCKGDASLFCNAIENPIWPP